MCQIANTPFISRPRSNLARHSFDAGFLPFGSLVGCGLETGDSGYSCGANNCRALYCARRFDGARHGDDADLVDTFKAYGQICGAPRIFIDNFNLLFCHGCYRHAYCRRFGNRFC